MSTAAQLVCTAQLAVGTKSAATQHAQRSPKFKLDISIVTAVATACLLAYFIRQHYRLSVLSAPAGISTIIGFVGVVLLFIQTVAIFVFAIVARKRPRGRQSTRPLGRAMRGSAQP